MINNKDFLFQDPFTTSEPSTPKSYLENCNLGKYFITYLKNLGIRTAIIEDYIDKDYLIDYQNFYCRSFENYERYTKRIHFFSYSFNVDEFKEKIENNNVDFLEKSYLGFLIIKPIRSYNNQWLIGRTLLKIPPQIKGKFIYKKYKVSLFGISIEIKSLPFQTQDQGVSACATIALWTALNPLSKVFNIAHYSPSEITEISASFPSQFRIFPSSGLTWEQMINFVRSLGLDIEIINILPAENDKIFTDAIKAYIENGMPLIGGLRLKKSGEPIQHHAVVISGYRNDDTGKITEIYIHDDQIGPYSSTLPYRSFKSWQNEWNSKGYCVLIEKLMVPIYHKLRLTFARIHFLYSKTKEASEKIDNRYEFSLYLFRVQKFKKFLLQQHFHDKADILLTFLPRFLWIIRITIDNSIICDYVYDATSRFPKRLLTIIY